MTLVDIVEFIAASVFKKLFLFLAMKLMHALEHVMVRNFLAVGPPKID